MLHISGGWNTPGTFNVLLHVPNPTEQRSWEELPTSLDSDLCGVFPPACFLHNASLCRSLMIFFFYNTPRGFTEIPGEISSLNQMKHNRKSLLRGCHFNQYQHTLWLRSVENAHNSFQLPKIPSLSDPELLIKYTWNIMLYHVQSVA